MLIILHEDNYVLVVNKPAGLQVESNLSGDTSLEQQVKNYLLQKYPWKKQLITGVVHRIDKPVSGAVLFALTPASLKNLSLEFEKKSVEKNYWALSEKQPAAPKGELRNWLIKDLKNRKALIVNPFTKDSKEAILEYEVLGQVSGLFLLKIKLHTGRYHQIRAQLSAVGCPICGDSKYGSTYQLAENTILLHSRSIGFVHPKTGEWKQIIAPLPDYYEWKIFGDFQ
jgi:23S rRNA pseudouridine1911/1915/1917 synthase